MSAIIFYMDKEALYKEMCNIGNNVFGVLTREGYDTKKFPIIEAGVEVLKTRGVEIVAGNPELPYLFFRDGQGSMINEKIDEMPEPIEPHYIVGILPPILREAGIAVGAEKIGKNNDGPIRVSFDSENSASIKKIFDDMIKNEGIPIISREGKAI